MTQQTQVTTQQHAAIAEYRAAYVTDDFNRKVFALDGLACAGLDGARATELIARGYDVYTNEGESE